MQLTQTQIDFEYYDTIYNDTNNSEQNECCNLYGNDNNHQNTLTNINISQNRNLILNSTNNITTNCQQNMTKDNHNEYIHKEQRQQPIITHLPTGYSNNNINESMLSLLDSEFQSQIQINCNQNNDNNNSNNNNNNSENNHGKPNILHNIKSNQTKNIRVECVNYQGIIQRVNKKKTKKNFFFLWDFFWAIHNCVMCCLCFFMPYFCMSFG